MSKQVWLISGINFDHKENGGNKSFSCKSKALMENMIVVPITKRIKIVMGLQVCLISRITFNCKENGGKKNFSSKSKASIFYIPMMKNDCSAENKKNKDYYEYPSLFHFMDEL